MSIRALFLAIMLSWNLKTSLKIDLKKQCHEMFLRENNGDGRASNENDPSTVATVTTILRSASSTWNDKYMRRKITSKL